MLKTEYTQADYKRMHKSFVEDMIDTLISEWHNPDTDPLRARVCRNLASQMEALREVTPDNLNVWVSAANEENNYKTIHSECVTHTNTDK